MKKLRDKRVTIQHSIISSKTEMTKKAQVKLVLNRISNFSNESIDLFFYVNFGNILLTAAKTISLRFLKTRRDLLFFSGRRTKSQHKGEQGTTRLKN